MLETSNLRTTWMTEL